MPPQGPVRPLVAAALVAVALGLGASGARAADGSAAPGASDAQLRRRLVEDLGSEAAAVREQATLRLESIDGVTADELLDALRSAGARARPLLFRIAAARGFASLAPVIAADASAPDVQAAEAAIRTLVSLGPDAVAAGRAALAAADSLGAADRSARLAHLEALDQQRRVEHEVISRWRRKGGSYRGRYAALADLGWPVQPVLLAMLLDVPLEDQFVVVPQTGDEHVDDVARTLALQGIAASRRRGYRTFEPLPPNIEAEELFDLAQQALADVADLGLMRGVLEDTHADLVRADGTVRWRLRPWEDGFAHEIEVILAARAAPELLDARRERLQAAVDRNRVQIRRLDPDDSADEFQYVAVKVQELAAVQHQLERFDVAESLYAEAIELVRRVTGTDPALAGYNRACALARGGRSDEAIRQLARALDPKVSAGFEDLTREWVLEDGDLESLHGDPRFMEIVRKRFGP